MPVERKAWACQTCKHFREYDDSNGMEHEPQHLQTWHVRECQADDGIDLSEKLRFDCPIWMNAEALRPGEAGTQKPLVGKEY